MGYKILIADDHETVRHSVQANIKLRYSDSIIIQANSCKEVSEEIENQNFDLLILDLNMDHINPLTFISEILEKHKKLKILIFSMYAVETFGVRLMKMGVKGYANKEEPITNLMRGIDNVLNGFNYWSSQISSLLVDQLENNQSTNLIDMLSDRELEVMLLLINGNTQKEISNTLSIHTSTIATYKNRILEKLNLKSFADLVLFAARNDLII
ncbi:MAG: hypothetical protein COA58_16820 [Bacteroidetes bacterium]|nr:MAG: hypothetical protein COA58_16820 [Bacteroidota bacterium]